MPSLKYRSARTEPLTPLGFGSHKLGGVRRIMYEFSNQVKVLHKVTLIDLLAQSAILLLQTQRVSGGHVELLKKYCYLMNPTACAIEFMITTCRGGLTCPP